MWLLAKLAPSSTKPDLDSVNGFFYFWWSQLDIVEYFAEVECLKRRCCRRYFSLVGICRATEIMKQNIFMPINYISINMYNIHNNELISMLAITDLSVSTDPISATTAV